MLKVMQGRYSEPALRILNRYDYSTILFFVPDPAGVL